MIQIHCNTVKRFDFILWPDSDSNIANKHPLCRVVVVHTTYIIELCLNLYVLAGDDVSSVFYVSRIVDSSVQRTSGLIFYRFILFVFESFKTSKLTVRNSVPMWKCITSVLLDFNLPVAYARCSHAQICAVVATKC